MNDGWVFSNLQKNSRDQKLKPVVTDCSAVSTPSNLAMSNLSCCKEGLLIFEAKFCLKLAFTTVVLVTTEGMHTGSDCVSSNICSTSLLLLLLFCCSFCGANNNKPFRFFSWWRRCSDFDCWKRWHTCGGVVVVPGVAGRRKFKFSFALFFIVVIVAFLPLPVNEPPKLIMVFFLLRLQAKRLLALLLLLLLLWTTSSTTNSKTPISSIKLQEHNSSPPSHLVQMHKKPATKTQSLSMHQIPKCRKSFFMQNADKTAPQNQSFLKNQISKCTDFFFSMMTWDTWLQKPFFQCLFLLGFAKPWHCH